MGPRRLMEFQIKLVILSSAVMDLPETAETSSYFRLHLPREMCTGYALIWATICVFANQGILELSGRVIEAKSTTSRIK